MANRRVLLVALGIMLANTLLAQQRSAQDSLEQEILAHPATERVLLGKSRAVLLESFKAADTAKARKVLQYMQAKFDWKRWVVLYPEEQLLVSYWLGDYSRVLSYARAVDTGGEMLEGIEPERDQFYDDMLDLSRKSEGALRMNVRRSSLAPYETDFALLLLSGILGQDRGDPTEREAFQKKMNDAADAYLTSYANSEYNPFVRKHLRLVMLKSVWGYGYGLSIGYLGLPSTLSRYMDDYALLTLCAEGAYKQAYAYIGFDIGMAHGLTQGFEYNGTWEEGLSVMHFSMLLSVGPMLELGSGFVAIPTAGISYMDFSPSETEKEKIDGDVSMSFAAWALGASFRIPLGGEEGTSFVTVNAGYRRAMTNIEMAKGGYAFITVGFGLFGRPMERDF
jgi:hypothetical protein